jgi:ABC-type dipeptide/oligopeptide/nickel transport system permease component
VLYASSPLTPSAPLYPHRPIQGLARTRDPDAPCRQNALIPVVPIMLDLPACSRRVITETIFAWPESVVYSSRAWVSGLPPLMGILMMGSFMVVF